MRSTTRNNLSIVCQTAQLTMFDAMYFHVAATKILCFYAKRLRLCRLNIASYQSERVSDVAVPVRVCQAVLFCA